MDLLRRTSWAAAIFLLASASIASAQQIDNPRYLAWAKFKPGANSRYDVSVSSSIQMQMKSKWTLKEVTDDHVVVSLEITVSVMGQNRTSAHDQTVSAKIEKRALKELGEEDIQAAGKTMHCTVLELPDDVPAAGGPAGQRDVTAKLWISNDVPGGTVKMEASRPAPAGGAAPAQRNGVTYLLTAFEAK